MPKDTVKSTVKFPPSLCFLIGLSTLLGMFSLPFQGQRSKNQQCCLLALDGKVSSAFSKEKQPRTSHLTIFLAPCFGFYPKKKHL